MEIKITDPDGNVFDSITVPDTIDTTETSEEYNPSVFLSPSFCREFREAANSSPIFWHDSRYMARYHLCCAVMDRLDTCIEKLNKYGDYPKSEEDFLVFMMFASMATDAVKEILSQLGIHKKKDPVYGSEDDYQHFLPFYLMSKVYNEEAKQPTDDEFFEYFRSLSFAHPAETSHQKFKRAGEIQYSPWVIVNREAMRLRGYEDGVGVRIYTSLSEDILDLRFPFATLKDYVRSRYERIVLATQWVYDQIAQAETEWRKHKINRSQSPIEILREMDQILTSRCEENYALKEAIRYMECELTDVSNLPAVELFRKAIADMIPRICDAVDNLNHNLAEELCYQLYERPAVMHQFASYQLEKIFSYLGENPSPYADTEAIFALQQAQYFSEGFANKWVNIDIKSMSHTEIQLLVRTACFLEKGAQGKGLD